ncbi:ATP-dependent DNA helicase [Myxococcota bacterium]|nr:ATP-dependent DNA helicase [Myxococcota bacterium]
MDLRKLLQARFGFPDYRPGQLEIVQHVADGDDALVVMPTGAGKSLCYQAPALARGGTTVVVSPLIALMKDQVDALVRKGAKAAFLNSSLSDEDRREVTARLLRGDLELLYVAPERFTPAFTRMLAGCDIRLFAIDEAHCLSQWGHDFRPDYLRLGQVRKELSARRPLPTVALTATATPTVQDDIVRTLGLGDARRFIRGFDRENLRMEVIQVKGLADKQSTLPELVRGTTALVYCATRKNVEKAALALHEAGVPAGIYHAGLKPEERSRAQDDFMSGKVKVVVATNAFGMGVDKEDVRTIVHWDIPGTVEAYYQEIGRAGRDNKPSRVVLLFDSKDRYTQEYFIKLGHPPVEYVHLIYKHLLKQRTNPIFLRLEDLALGLPPDNQDERTAAACLYVLQREGWVRRIHPADRPARVAVRTDAPKKRPDGIRGQVWDAVIERVVDGFGADLYPDRLAKALGLERDQLTAALKGLEERKYLQVEPPTRVGGVELLHDATEELDFDEEKLRTRRQHEFDKLEKMLDYTQATCRRRYLLEYFGQAPAYARCGNCDACREGVTLAGGPRALSPDEENAARKVLACVARMKDARSVGMVAKVLTGSEEQSVRNWRYDQLSTYGLLRQHTVAEVTGLLEALTRAGALERRHVTKLLDGREITYAELHLTALGGQVMLQQAPDFRMAWPKMRIAAPPRPRAVAAPGATASRPVSSDLLSYLKEIRRKLAEAEDVPAYVIAPNRTLEAIAAERPTSPRSLLKVHGMGPERIKRYGQPFLDALAAFEGR